MLSLTFEASACGTRLFLSEDFPCSRLHSNSFIVAVLPGNCEPLDSGWPPFWKYCLFCADEKGKALLCFFHLLLPVNRLY